MDTPLGEIVYEENNLDTNLKNIDQNPEFICFVNKAQSATFNEFGSHQHNSFISQDYNYTINGKVLAKYRFYARSMHIENKNNWQEAS